jgi:aminomethyltransferase
MVDFAGWQMPIHYTSQIKEHTAVRTDKGMFDVSHMMAVDFTGPDLEKFLMYVLANDVRKVKIGKALYTCMLNEKAGVVDDLIVYHLDENYFRIVVNAGNRESDVKWFESQKGSFDVHIQPRAELAIIAVQGPNARATVNNILPKECVTETLLNLKPFSILTAHNWMIARTGYTGEDGYEIILPSEKANDLWDKLVEAGVEPIGLGARDTLRLEAGLNLYGSDMDEVISPYECGLAWTVSMTDDRDFVGKSALEKIAETDHDQLYGVILETRGVLRAHLPVDNENGIEACMTSGTYSPTLSKSIGLVRAPKNSQALNVNIRGKCNPLTLVKPPFVRNGKIIYKSI